MGMLPINNQGMQTANCACPSGSNLLPAATSAQGLQAQQPATAMPFNQDMSNSSIMNSQTSPQIGQDTLMLMTQLSSMMLQVTMMVNQTLMMLLQSQQSGSGAGTSAQALSNGTGALSTSSTDSGTTSGSSSTGSGSTSESGAVDSSGFSQDWSDKLTHVPDNEKQAFLNRVLEIAANIEMDPDHLMAIFMSESGMNPKAVNSGSGATGLIQWLPSTARGMGTSTSELKNMSALQQLEYVEKYLSPYKGRLKSKADAYMAVFSPAFIGKGDDHVAYSRGQGAYAGNKGLDANNDGKITNGELAVRLDKFLA